MIFERVLDRIGQAARSFLIRNFYLGAISTECVANIIRPASWVQPVRSRLVKQILFAGVEAIPFTAFSGTIMGIVLTINSYQWLELTGGIEFLGPVVSLILIREAAPFFACFIVISASASAITTELANMRVSGEIDLVESQGINLVQLLIVPRALGLSIASAVLAMIFVASAFAASALAVLMIGRIPLGPFFNSIFESLSKVDLYNLVGRSAVASFFIGVICCFEGLNVVGPTTSVPRAVTKGMLRSVEVTLIVSAGFAVLTYL